MSEMIRDGRIERRFPDQSWVCHPFQCERIPLQKRKKTIIFKCKSSIHWLIIFGLVWLINWLIDRFVHFKSILLFDRLIDWLVVIVEIVFSIGSSKLSQNNSHNRKRHIIDMQKELHHTLNEIQNATKSNRSHVSLASFALLKQNSANAFFTVSVNTGHETFSGSANITQRTRKFSFVR